ncbi:MAG: copper resistance protein CopC [Solibacillus sp.]|uniref:copper resistance CopC family protein n=1 Tax=Solibacillus sp. TaxID=1909654 RepID=UPI0033158AE9
MKALVLSILAALVLFVPNAAAHTYLSETTPQDGATVTENVSQVVLTYQGKIEQGSTFKAVAADGTEYTPANVELVDGVLTGTFEPALPNDVYTVKWNSISQDGHPLSGEFSFTVDAPVVEEPVEQVEATEATSVETTVASEEETTTEKTSPLIFVGAILLAIIFVSGIALVMRKKK